jgi:hypothetical protein
VQSQPFRLTPMDGDETILNRLYYKLIWIVKPHACHVGFQVP